MGIATPLTSADAADLRVLLDRDPIANCFAISRLLREGRVEVDPWRGGGDLWGVREGGHLRSAVYVGANLVPLGTTERTRPLLAARIGALPRRCSSLVGPAAEVLGLWAELETAWGPAREVRGEQPLLAMDRDPQVAPDPLVRAVRPEEIDLLMPACVAMFTEEVGVSPVAGGMASAYRARISELVHAGRAFARIEDGRVLFKAELGAVTAQVCQVQGVWVAPGMRGRGLSTAGMAAVVRQARARVAPCVSLYVNAYNIPARAAYARVGFDAVGTFATVLF